jgi:hypothetical protein
MIADPWALIPVRFCRKKARQGAASFKILVRWMSCSIVMSILLSCTSVAPRSLCPDIGGIYADRAQGDKGSLLASLIGPGTPSASTVQLTVDTVALHVEASGVHRTLQSPADFSCSKGTEMTLTRKVTRHIRLPPLIDQSVVTSYRFRKTDAGDLQMDVYSQTTASPYGLRLSGPEQLDHTVIWAARSRR